MHHYKNGRFIDAFSLIEKLKTQQILMPPKDITSNKMQIHRIFFSPEYNEFFLSCIAFDRIEHPLCSDPFNAKNKLESGSPNPAGEFNGNCDGRTYLVSTNQNCSTQFSNSIFLHFRFCKNPLIRHE